MDSDIQETVESLLGKDIKIVDCEKKSNVHEEEILLVNGIPVTLDCKNGQAIKNSLLQGNVPDCELLNDILIKAGLLKSPIKLETSLCVKTSTTTKEEVTVSKGGHIVDGSSRETKENNMYTSETSEIWKPAATGVFHSDTFSKKPVVTTPSSTDDLDTSFSSCSLADCNSFPRQFSQQTNEARFKTDERVRNLEETRRYPVSLKYPLKNSSAPNTFSHFTASDAVCQNGQPGISKTKVTSVTESPSLSLSSVCSSLPSSSSSV